MIETPVNLTRNILLGMLLGFIIGASFYYLEFIPKSVEDEIFMVKGLVKNSKTKEIIPKIMNKIHASTIDID